MTAVRSEHSGDVTAIHAVNVAAFPTSAEALLVDRLRARDDLVLSLVAEHGREIVGHAAFSRIVIERDGAPGRAVALAPIAVLPQHQRKGIGTALIERGLALLDGTGEVAVFVLGDPAYYSRFGFTVVEAARFTSEYSGPYLQARRLGDQIAAPGRLRYSSAFAALG